MNAKTVSNVVQTQASKAQAEIVDLIKYYDKKDNEILKLESQIVSIKEERHKKMVALAVKYGSDAAFFDQACKNAIAAIRQVKGQDWKVPNAFNNDKSTIIAYINLGNKVKPTDSVTEIRKAVQADRTGKKVSKTVSIHVPDRTHPNLDVVIKETVLAIYKVAKESGEEKALELVNKLHAEAEAFLAEVLKDEPVKTDAKGAGKKHAVA